MRVIRLWSKQIQIQKQQKYIQHEGSYSQIYLFTKLFITCLLLSRHLRTEGFKLNICHIQSLCILLYIICKTISMTTLKQKLNLAVHSKAKRMNKNNITRIMPSILTNFRLNKEDYNASCYKLANFLLGKLIVRQVENVLLKGRIVETECYLGREDKASHSYNGR